MSCGGHDSVLGAHSARAGRAADVVKGQAKPILRAKVCLPPVLRHTHEFAQIFEPASRLCSA